MWKQTRLLVPSAIDMSFIPIYLCPQQVTCALLMDNNLLAVQEISPETLLAYDVVGALLYVRSSSFCLILVPAGYIFEIASVLLPLRGGSLRRRRQVNSCRFLLLNSGDQAYKRRPEQRKHYGACFPCCICDSLSCIPFGHVSQAISTTYASYY